MTDSEPADAVVRAMTDDGAFRVMTLCATDTVRRAVERQAVRGPAAAQLGEVMCGAVLVRETMAPPHRVQVVLADQGDGLVVGDAWPEGRTRGLVQQSDAVLGIDLTLATVQVERAMPRGLPHRGVVDVPAGAGIDGALTHYFRRSEQIETVVAVACVTDDDGMPLAAGGFVVQLLPELTDPPLAAMRRRLQRLGDLGDLLAGSGDDPNALLAAVLADSAHTVLASSPVTFHCPCSRSRAIGAAAALGADELRQLIADGETLRLHCDYCRTAYEVGPADFARILAESAS